MCKCSSHRGQESFNGVPPVFIVGCIRSGTTILHRMLSAYCTRAIDLDEGDFECRPFWQKRGFQIGSALTGTRCHGYDGSELCEDTLNDIRVHVNSRTAGGRHVVTKNPHLANKIGLVHACFPEARFVHIIREPMAVVASTKLRFIEQDGARINPWGVRFVQYWPETDDLPCWWTVPVEEDCEFKEPLKQRIKKFINGKPLLRQPQHEDPLHFMRAHPDRTRYYPGEGFKRIPESWLKINANVVRQVDQHGLGDRYLAVNYADVVNRLQPTLQRIAEFAGIPETKPGAVPEVLDETRSQKWKKDLTADEQAAVSRAIEMFDAEAEIIRTRLPGPLLETPAHAMS